MAVNDARSHHNEKVLDAISQLWVNMHQVLRNKTQLSRIMFGRMEENTEPTVPLTLRLDSELEWGRERIRRSSPVALRRPAGDFPLTADADSPAEKTRQRSGGEAYKRPDARPPARSLPHRWTRETTRTRDRAPRTIKDK